MEGVAVIVPMKRNEDVGFSAVAHDRFGGKNNFAFPPLDQCQGKDVIGLPLPTFSRRRRSALFSSFQ